LEVAERRGGYAGVVVVWRRRDDLLLRRSRCLEEVPENCGGQEAWMLSLGRWLVILPPMALVVACMLLASFFYLSFFVPFKF